jgi:hypothetical protein
MKNFVVLDTNILIRIVSQGQQGFEHWDELRAMVERGEVTLLSPAIVLMEFQKQVWNSEEDFHIQTARILESLKATWGNLWNEVRDNLKGFLEAQLAQWRTDIQNDWKKKGEEISAWLKGNQVVVLPFNQDIWFRAKQRLIEGRLPKSTNPKESDKDNKSKAREWERDNDCCLIESLVAHFTGDAKDKQLFLCTENLDDFGFKVEAKKSLDSRLQVGLPPCEIFTDLKSLVTALKEQKKVELPTPQEVEKALEDKAKGEDVLESVPTYGIVSGTLVPMGRTWVVSAAGDHNGHAVTCKDCGEPMEERAVGRIANEHDKVAVLYECKNKHRRIFAAPK